MSESAVLASKKSGTALRVVKLLVPALVGALIMFLILTPNVGMSVVNTVTGKSSQLKCQAQAVEQLPRTTVREVEATAAAHQLLPTELKTILTSPAQGGYVARANVTFDSKLCGFVGFTDNVRVGDAIWGDPFLPDTIVTVLRDGEVHDSDGQCVSNTFPFARVINRQLHLVINCDREYPADLNRFRLNWNLGQSI